MNTSPHITIYGSDTCAYCTAARMLLKKKGLTYDDVLVSKDPKKRQEMITRSGSPSVPQIFIGEQAIGGFDELYALEKNGELDRLLGLEA
ncbi:MAG: glutaredoxin 3 [Gammaproteobacteria bacterium]|nr:MAG: glutaredoxin 3 [Gammaproteobacteria bacterium]